MSDGIVQKAISCLGRGFDLSSDFRLKYCKGDGRLIHLNETDKRELHVPGFGSFKGVSIDIKCDKGDRTRIQSDILDFNQMSELFNRKSSVPGKVPSGLFNSMFVFESRSWARDASNTKYLGLDGYFITLFSIHIDRYPLILDDQVRNDVPSTWDPSALARFIEKYGTHLIVGLSLGGQDVVLVKQDKSSSIEPSEIKTQLDDLGDQLFNGTCMLAPIRNKETKTKVLQAFNVFDPQSRPLSNYASITEKDGISVLCSRRGGDPSASTHCEWLLTVPSIPDAIHFTFIPITSLLRGVQGRGFLSHAINLYLRYKPPIGDLQYFLDFQAHKIWAPIHNDLPLGPTRSKAQQHQTPTLNFNLMGPKLHVNATPVLVGKIPVTGMRLYLEGIKCNRLAIHLQHLVSTPVLLQNKIHQDPLLWRGSEQNPDVVRFFEPIQWKKFSHICTAPVKFDPAWLDPPTNNRDDGAFIVTGAHLHVKRHDARAVLHLRLSYSRVSGCYVVQSNWMHFASESQNLKSGFFPSISTSCNGNVDKERPAAYMDSGVYPAGPPVPVQTQKMLRFVDTAEMCRGPSDSPGHWLVTGAKLDLEKGRICLRVKFSLLNLFSID